MFNEKEFDQWVNEYDDMVDRTAKVNKFPFAGYYDVLDDIYNEIIKKPNASVLDLGFGTAKLTSRLYDYGCLIYGQDYSSNMIELASSKMPNAKLFQGDFSNGLVDSLSNNKYDFIISTYALHHLTNENKVSFIKSLLKLLNDDGKIIIGDITFNKQEELDICKAQAKDDWDAEESYFVIDDLKQIFPNLSFKKKSFCAGVLIIPSK